LKITDLKTTVLFCPFPEIIADAARSIKGRDVLLVEIDTDEGLTGLGFITGLGVAHGSEIPVINTIVSDALRPTVIGRDPLTIDRLWADMYGGTTRFGRRGATLRAISAVDIALWDLLGKKAGLPVYRLLGGYSNKVRVYASGGFYNAENDLEKLTKEISSYVKKGFTAVKMKVGKNPGLDVERVAAVRKTIGDEIDLLIDANEAWDFSTALRFARDVEKYHIYWLEEPVKPDDLEGFIELTAKSPIPIAAGENEYTKYGFKDLIINKAVNVVQPDVTRVGGITEYMKVAHFAEAFHMPCLNHAVQEVHVSLIAATSNAPMMEYFPKEQYLQTFLSELFVEPATIQEPRNGFVTAPESPGLGLKIDPVLREKFTVKKV
jgi:D-arabinonate dehydratase